MQDEKLRAAFESWETLSGSPEEIEAYEVRLKHVLDEEAAIREAELREQEAREEGRQSEKEITTRRLLAKNMTIKEISEITDLDEKRILEIHREMEN